MSDEAEPDELIARVGPIELRGVPRKDPASEEFSRDVRELRVAVVAALDASPVGSLVRWMARRLGK